MTVLNDILQQQSVGCRVTDEALITETTFFLFISSILLMELNYIFL